MARVGSYSGRMQRVDIDALSCVLSLKGVAFVKLPSWLRRRKAPTSAGACTDGALASPAIGGNPESDISRESLDRIYELLRVDEEWSVRADQGFTWWMGQHAQELIASKPTLSRGIWVSRLIARTAVAVDVPRTEKTYERLAALNMFMTTSALVLGNDGVVRMITSAVVHKDVADWMTGHFALRAAMQAADCEIKAPYLMELNGWGSAVSDHPLAGRRLVLDDMAEIISRLVAPLGQEPSKWAGQEMDSALGTLRKTSLFANGDPTGVTAEFPYKDFSALLQLEAGTPHPQVGHGLHITLRLPSPPFDTSVHEAAAILNEMEARGLSLFSTLHGAWCVSPSGDVAFNAFVPNAFYKAGTAVNFALWMTGKARWVASLNDPRSDEERWEEGKPAIARLLDELE